LLRAITWVSIPWGRELINRFSLRGCYRQLGRASASCGWRVCLTTSKAVGSVIGCEVAIQGFHGSQRSARSIFQYNIWVLKLLHQDILTFSIVAIVMHRARSLNLSIAPKPDAPLGSPHKKPRASKRDRGFRRVRTGILRSRHRRPVASYPIAAKAQGPMRLGRDPCRVSHRYRKPLNGA